MTRKFFFLLIPFLGIILITIFSGNEKMISKNSSQSSSKKTVQLPPPEKKGPLSLEETLSSRRSVRAYRDQTVSLKEVGQLLWAAQGITSKRGLRTAPSAGALYPIEIYVAASKVENLEEGIYRYNSEQHAIILHAAGDFQSALARSALGQRAITDAAVNIIICGVFTRTTGKYGERGIRYVWMEAGHVAQNIHLQCEPLNLGTVCIGAFYDERVQKTLSITEAPLYIMPVGKR